MKILAAKFVLEANEHVPMKCDMENVAVSYGKEALTHMQLGTVFDDKEIELIPVICADAACSGVMRKNCFDYIENRILGTIRESLQDLDGIYLHLHGASYIEGIGSGEHHLVQRVRDIVGPYMPIGVSCDPHGNLTQNYVENINIIRSFREAPHTDIPETVQFVCRELVKLIRNRKRIIPVYRKLPLILGGEQSVSADEPVLSINKYMNEIEKDNRILSCSWHVGYLRHDCPEAGCGIIVIPASDEFTEYASKAADDLAEYVFAKRHEFHYTGLTLAPREAVEKALDFEGKPVFITDSGDNVTSGAVGGNTFVFRQFLALENLQKKILFASINDPESFQLLSGEQPGDEVDISLGAGIDDLSQKVDLKVAVKYEGRQEGTRMYGEQGDYGGLVTVNVIGTTLDVVVTDTNHSFVEEHQISACGVDWDDYDIIVVKQGYIHPELKEKGKLNIMSLTGGATPQDTKLIDFKQVMRPMFPLDDI